MALVLKDRIKETTTTTGSASDYSLGGAFSGFEAFSEIGDTNETYYACTDGTDWEIGRGTYSASGNSLTRTAIATSNSDGSKIDWGAGTKTIFVTQPADKAVFLDGNGDVSLGNNLTVTGNLTVNGTTTTVNSTVTTLDDPILTLGGDTAPSVDDNKDRGVEFRWHDGSAAKVGFFGFDDSTGRFTFIPDATNTSEVFSGTKGDLDVGDLNVTGLVSLPDGSSTDNYLGIGNSDDFKIYHDGSQTVISNVNGSGPIKLQGKFGEQSIIANQDGAVELYHNNAKKFETRSGGGTVTGALALNSSDYARIEHARDGTDIWSVGLRTDDDYHIYRESGSGNVVLSAGHLELGDSQEIRLGDGGDLKIYHDGSNSVIADNGTGKLLIYGNDQIVLQSQGTNEPFIKCTSDEGVNLFYNNYKTLATTSEGVDVYNNDATNADGPVVNLRRDSASPAVNDRLGDVRFLGRNDAAEYVGYAGIDGIIYDETDGTENGALRISALNNGTNTTYLTFGDELARFNQDARFDDNVKAKFGTGSDLQIYHDGTGSYISEQGTGLLYINSTPGGWIRVGSGDETSAYFKGNGAAELYYDNSKKFETLSTGGLVQSSSGAASLEIRNTNNDTGTSRLTFSTDDGSTYNQFRYSWDDDEFQWWEASSNIMSLAAGQLTLTSTDAGASAGPVLKFNRDSASPAFNDFLGEIQFDGDDAGGNSTTYAKITGAITDTTDGSEDGRIKFDVLGNGGFATYYQIGYGGNFMYRNLNLMHNVDLVFEGSTDDTNETTLTVADPTADRTITLPDATGEVLVKDSSDIVTITSTDAGDADAPILKLYRDSASPADGDDMGRIQFTGKNDAGQDVDYAVIFSEIADASDGTEDSRLKFLTVRDGSSHTTMEVKFGTVSVNGQLNITTGADIRFEGATADDFETTLSPGDPTADRTVTLPDATGTVVVQDSSGHISLGDNEEIRFGDSEDLEIYHSGGNSIIRENNAFPLYLQTDNNSLGVTITKKNAAETMAKFIADGAVELYYDNTKRLQTTSTGVTIPGDLYITDNAAGFGQLELAGASGAYIDLKSPSSDDYDMRLITDGTTSNIRADDLHLQSASSENYIDATANGAVNLYYDNISKLSTTSDGVQITDNGAGSTAVLELGTAATTEKGELRLHGSTANKYSEIFTSNGNLHIDSAGTGHGIYLNWYTSDGGTSHSGVYFGSGNQGQVAKIDAAGNFTLNGNIDVNDTKEVRFGNDDDLKIYHDGSNSYIDEAGTGNLYIRAGGTNNISLTDNGTYLYYSGNTRLQTTTDGVDIINSDSGSAIGPKLHLYRDSSSPADFDDLGALYFTGNDDGGNRQEYAYIRGELYDATNGSEDAAIRHFARVGGSDMEHIRSSFGTTAITGQLFLEANPIHPNPHIKFEGSTADNFETGLFVADPSADRTITLPDATGEVVVGASLFPSGTTNDGLPTAKALNLANPVENDDHVFHPYLNNDLGHFIERGGSYAWGGLSSNPSESVTKTLFNANGDFVSINDSNISGSSYTLTLTNLPKGQSYSSYIGIVFGHHTFAPGSIVIETSTDGGSNWTTRLNDSSSKAVYACTYDTGGTATNAIRFTFTAAPGSAQVRIQSIAAYNYNSAGMENYFLPLKGGVVYGNTTINGTLSATTKSFDIPHPTQDGMRLRYGSLEGPENGVYVRGRLTGSSVIELPEHWSGLVDEDSITVQLTAIGKSQDLWVEDVSIEQVRVCDASTDCFYMVMAERKDVDKLEVEYAAEV